MPETQIQLVDVGKRYSKLPVSKMLAGMLSLRKNSSTNWFWALDQVNLSVSGPGKRIGIIGVNGSGKTTLLRLIAGVTRPTRGTVMVHGRIVSLLELFAGMQSDLTGRENIFLNGILLGMKRQEVARKFDSIVQFSGVENFLDMPLKHYSLGMTMRLGFSVATHVDADIFLVDEALGVGDAQFMSQSMERLREIRKQGAIMILVSHDTSVIRHLSDETLWLHQGRVAGFGPSEQIVEAYLKATRKAGKEPISQPS